jgi:two-component system NtrC family sensor kinase
LIPAAGPVVFGVGDERPLGAGVTAFVHSATARLLIPLLITIVVVFSIYAVLSFRATKRELTDSVYLWAYKFGDLVKRATNHGMLLNRKEDVQYNLQIIGANPGVEGLHVYDKLGTIAFSSKLSEIGKKVDRKAEACIVCHGQTAPLHEVSTDERTRVYRNSAGRRVFGVIEPIENEPRCAQGGCHASVAEQTILGVLDVQMSLDPLDKALEEARRRWLWLTMAMVLMVSAATIALVYRIVRRPVIRLYQGTRRIARGDLETRIDVTSRDELGQLAEAFNHMTQELRNAHEEASNWSQRLEQKVVEKTEELGRIQRQVMLMEKMASLGKLAATVAHELNNPLGGILNYAKLIDRELREGGALDDVSRQEILRYLSVIQQESRRSGEIVRNLLLFARQSHVHLADMGLEETVNRAVLLMNHRMEMLSIRLDRTREPGDDTLVGDADQIQQALVALMVNAIDAMEENGSGTLGVCIAPGEDTVELRVSDTGVGIPDDIVGHIFEPFFSTKSKESGVGLGLAVVFGIVRGHGGTIDVQSQVGQGSTFTLRLPRRPVATRSPKEEHE